MTHLDKGRGRVLKRAFSGHEPTAQGPPGDAAQGGTQCSVGDTLQAWTGFGDLALGRPLLDFPGSSDEKESAHNVGDLCSVPGWGRSPGGRHGNTQVFLPRGSHGQRSLAGYSPWDCKELDTTEQLSLPLLRPPSWYITNPECPTSRPGHCIGTHTALLLKYLPPRSLPEQYL